MCGLVGIINRSGANIQEEAKLNKLFSQMLYCGALRGTHGTGILSVDSDGEINSFKKPLNSSDFLELSSTKKIIDGDYTFLLGHNRFATLGKHTVNNTHPFNHDNIHLFHNGTVDNYRNLIKDNKHFDTDSESITYILSKESCVVSALERIEGAYVLVWFDSESKTLNFARNKERPLFIAEVSNSKSMIYASEKEMIEWLTFRNKIKISSIKELEVGKLVSIPLNDDDPIRTCEFKPKKVKNNYSNYYQSGSSEISYLIPNKLNKIFEVKIDSWTPYNVNYDNKGITYGYLSGKYKDSFVKVNSIPSNTKNDFIGKLIKFCQTSEHNGIIYGNIEKIVEVIKEPIEYNINIPIIKEKQLSKKPLIGPRGREIDSHEFSKLTNGGCLFCGGNITEEEDGDEIYWTWENDPICSTCYKY